MQQLDVMSNVVAGLTLPLALIVLAAAVAFPFVFQDPYLIGVALAGLLYLVVTESWNLVLGVIFVLIITFMPEGLEKQVDVRVNQARH